MVPSLLPWASECLTGPSPGGNPWQAVGVPRYWEGPGIGYVNLSVRQPGRLMDPS